MILQTLFRRIKRPLLIAAVCAMASPCFAESPLSPVKTDTPRETMTTFMEAMNDYAKGVKNGNGRLEERINDAIRCLAPASTRDLISQRDKKNAAIFLKETIDRIIVIDPEKIPEETDLKRWRLKDTEVVLKPITEGERAGEWLISYDTWSRAKDFFNRVKDLPYLPNSGKGAMYREPWVEKLAPAWSQDEVLGLKKWQWLGLLGALLLGFVLKLVVEALMGFVKRLSFLSKKQWQKEMLEVVGKPAGLVAATLFWYLSLLFLQIEGLAFDLFNGALQVVFGASLIWAAYQLIAVAKNFFVQLAEKSDSPLDNQLIPFVEKTLKIVVVLLGILMVLQNMGVNVFSLLAGLGLGGLALALAAKDTAANLFGSIMILIDRPFKLGDWIVVGDVEGTVEEIGFRSTRVRTFYKSLVSLPNSIVATTSIDNMGMRPYRRVTENIRLAYDTPADKIESFMEGIRKLIETHPQTHKDVFYVAFTGYKDSFLEIMVYFFIETDAWSEELETKQNIFLGILQLAECQGVEFAFPTRTVHLQEPVHLQGLVQE